MSVNAPTDSVNHPTPWLSYKRPYVRDLAYAIACPTVITHWVNHQPLHHSPAVSVHNRDFWQQQFEAYAPRLAELDASNTQNSDYQALNEFLMNRPSPHRLGFHFEGLMHYWLLDGFEHGYHHFEVLAHNVQLYREKQTIGELDFILRNHETGDIEHWELAIKFFVGSPPYDYADWVGLNSRDNLELKMTHMQTRQFNTVWVDVMDVAIADESSQDNTEPKPIKRVKIDKRIGVIKGRFFKPIIDSDFLRPGWLTTGFPLHDWVDSHDLDQLNRFDISLNTNSLRRAEYVEWFTKRSVEASIHIDDDINNDDDNNNDHHKDNDNDKTNPVSEPASEPTSLTQPLKSGLYFVEDTPVVIYHPDRDKEDDKF